MAEGGVAGTTVGQIEVAANVSGSQLYHYFADKRASVRAIINYQTRSFLDAQQPYGCDSLSWPHRDGLKWLHMDDASMRCDGSDLAPVADTPGRL